VTILLGLLAQFWPYILLIGGGLLLGMKQRKAGADSVRAKQAEADRRVRDISDEIMDDVRAMSPEQVEAELRKRARKK
jgi:hypothetical protein